MKLDQIEKGVYLTDGKDLFEIMNVGRRIISLRNARTGIYSTHTRPELRWSGSWRVVDRKD
jgi:hypothetical protein